MSRALATLARLRRLETDQAKCAVDTANLARDAAEEKRVTAAYALEREMPAGHLLGGAYAAWLPAAFAAITGAETAARQAEAARSDAVQVLVAHKAGLKAVERLMETAAAQERTRAQRRAQVRLDDIGRKV